MSLASILMGVNRAEPRGMPAVQGQGAPAVQMTVAGQKPAGAQGVSNTATIWDSAPGNPVPSTSIAPPIDQSRSAYGLAVQGPGIPAPMASPAGTNTYQRPMTSQRPMGSGMSRGQMALAQRQSSGPAGGGAADVEIGPADYSQFERFSDAAYEQARRYLDPEIDRQRSRFAQDLVNRGIDPSSPEGLSELESFERRISDMNSRASFDALQEGRSFQDQLFQQGLGEASLRTDLEGRRIAANAQRDTARTAAAASRYSSDRGLDGLLARLDEDGRQFDLNLGQRESEFGRNYGLSRDQFGRRNYESDREFGENQYRYDRGADLAEFLGYANVDQGYGSLGIQAGRLDLDRRRQEEDALWRFLGGLPQQTVGPYRPNSGAAVQGVAQGSRTGAGIADLFSGLFSDGGGG